MTALAHNLSALPFTMLLTLAAVFVAVTLLAFSASSFVSAASATGRKRLMVSLTDQPSSVLTNPAMLSIQAPLGEWQHLAKYLPRSDKDLVTLRLKLLRAGFRSPVAPLLFTIAELVGPVVAAVLSLVFLKGQVAFLAAAGTGILAFVIPGLVVGQRLSNRRKEIENGLPDALDLLVVCIEAGCGIDQAIVKAGEELAITYPTLSDELRILTTEVRAGKSRLEAFKNLAQRTKVDDVRALVAMLVQTDKFGTSIGQALRMHAEISRTKRRQRAEERAQKIGVKLVFPLVLMFFPAFFIVVLGPAVIQFMHTFMTN